MWPLILSATTSFLLAPLVIRFYRSHNWVDDPHKSKHAKKTHLLPVPRGGGLVVYAGILLASLIFLQIDKYLIGILLGGLLLVIGGVLDDIFDIHPLLRLGINILSALIVVGFGIGIAYVTNPFGPGVIHLNWPQIPIFLFGKTRTIWILADLFALLFIVWNMNIVNWAKGVDGQLPGFVSIAAIMIGLLSYQFIDDPTQFNTAHLSFIVAGAYLGLLFWNWYPQKMMPGYGAGSLAGYLLSILAILSGAKVATILMILAIPTADAIFTILRRIVAGKSPFWGDRGHLHHKLMDVLGWGKRRIAIFYWTSSLGLGWLSLHLQTWGKIVTLILVMGLVFGFLIWAKLHQLKQNEISD
ncbi:undecaprenyl/decaprenyl-phosphate alpha-N-acetylglucosaminyl 1-phosphate transferase [Patescibacteria group bacterium]|nr:undecaprenyl/decaprenyl-phosphate alpha-N-acetylglucosaminyl 1-phosphate transferase [Patescibacteria group bacterium]MBU1885102.1 undecaprenyl/decaprenyl-phosphate alpha-N-acetylglucosaminyl 1-phosphate transferase [Patescibacteria group bacterium]